MASGNFKISIKMNSANQIIKNHGLDENGFVTKFLRDEVERLSDPYVPMLNGGLKNNKSYPNNHSIKYNSPYARYQYYGKVMVGKPPKQVTDKDLQYSGAPKRGMEWDKRMMNDRRKEVCKDVENFIKNGGK